MKELFILLTLTLGGCASLPQGIEPVTEFDLNRYLGTWYEIARLDHSFERGLTKVTAEYSMRADGSVSVVNRGFSEKNGRWETAEGRAKVVQAPDVGYLKVSFFRPFYGAYVIVELDSEYQYALVCGPNREYLWLLARKPELDVTLQTRLFDRARALGFKVEDIILVSQ